MNTNPVHPIPDPIAQLEKVQRALAFAIYFTGNGIPESVHQHNKEALSTFPALIEQVKEMQKLEWQDIATAPKDGNDILFWVHDEDEGDHYAIGSWQHYDIGWMWTVHFDSGCEPTHWMPLPTTPSPKSRP